MRDIKEAYYKYPANITCNGNGYKICFVDFPELLVQAEEPWDAINQAGYVLARHLESYLKSDQEFPNPSSEAANKLIRPSFDEGATLYLAETCVPVDATMDERGVIITNIYLEYQSYGTQPDDEFLYREKLSGDKDKTSKHPSELPEMITLCEAVTLVATGRSVSASDLVIDLDWTFRKSDYDKLEFGDMLENGIPDYQNLTVGN